MFQNNGDFNSCKYTHGIGRNILFDMLEYYGNDMWTEGILGLNTFISR